MIVLLRSLLFLGMLLLIGQSISSYAYHFTNGYPIAPLIGLCLCYWGFIRTRPLHYHSRRPVARMEYPTFDAALLILLAIIGAALTLHQREEPLFSAAWYVHMTILTLFVLLVSRIVGELFNRGHLLATTLASLFLIGILWNGTGRVATSDLELQPMPRSGRNASEPLPH